MTKDQTASQLSSPSTVFEMQGRGFSALSGLNESAGKSFLPKSSFLSLSEET